MDSDDISLNLRIEKQVEFLIFKPKYFSCRIQTHHTLMKIIFIFLTQVFL